MTGFDLRPLSTGEIFDRAFTIYRQRFSLFIGIAAIPHLLTLAVQLTMVTIRSRSPMVTIAGRPQPLFLPGGVLLNLVFGLVSIAVSLVVYVLAEGGTVQAVSELYLGRNITIGAALRRAWQDFGTLVGVSVLSGLAIGGAFLLLVVPGIYVACRLVTCLPAALVEGRGPSESLSRSWNLTRGYAGRAFLLMLLYLVMAFAIGGMLGAPIGLAIAKSQGSPALLPIWLALQQLASTVTTVLVSPFFLIGSCVLYYDLRVRKEAFDLQFMMDPNSERLTRDGGSVPSIL